MSTEPPTTSVPDGTEATHCPHCERPFSTERLRAIHLGEVHADRLTESERERYEEAIDDEADELFIFHLKVVAAIVVLSLGFTYTYALVWTG